MTSSASRAAALPRVLEPEVMDTPEEALDYDAMDHSEVNARFCEDLAAFTPLGAGTRVLDVGTGTARIPIELCTRNAAVLVLAVDLAAHMLEIARANVERAGLAARIELRRVDAKGLPFEDGAFRVTVSNSIVHHIPEPREALAAMWRVTAPGGVLFVRDLHRPQSSEELAELVTRYGGTPPEDPRARRAFEHQRELFRASLHAALTVDEVADLAASLGIPREAVRRTSDRHWTLAYQTS